jgi:vitamin B12 transporter
VNELNRIFDFPFQSFANINRAGFGYQGDYVERSWAQTTVGYEFEDENGFTGDPTNPPLTHGLRLNHSVYGQQLLSVKRLSLVLGSRYVHNTTFGNKFVPRAAVGIQLLKGGSIFSGTQLRASYATGIKEPRLEESFASGPFILPSPKLKAEENRAFEAGIQQGLFGGKYALTATYYNNLFRNQIDFSIVDFTTFIGQYMNINKSIAHGAEFELRGHILPRLALDAGYNYASTQILQAPAAFDDIHQPGNPLIRRPKHSGSVLLSYSGNRWGGNLGGSFVGRRQDSDFLGLGIHHAAGYARVDIGAWYRLQSHVTAYANLENAFNKHYEEVVGYPALGMNIRAGLRFRFGGE